MIELINIQKSYPTQTLHRDLKELTKTHEIVRFALFDQFAYTNHIESGVILKKIR